MSAPTYPPPRAELRLPDVGPPGRVQDRWIHRAVGLTLLIFLLLLAAAGGAAVLVRINVTVDGSGALEPAGVWPVRGQEAGVVREVLVAMGDSVRAGQVVARLDTLQLASALDQLLAEKRALELDQRAARSTLPLEERELLERRAQADARVMRARAALRQRVVENGLGTNADAVMRSYVAGTHIGIDIALADVLAAEAELRTLKIQGERLELKSLDLRRQEEEMERLLAQIKVTRQRLARLTLRAPADGLVLTHEMERLPGTIVREGETLLEVAEPGGWRVTLLIPEREVHRVRPGDAVKVELPAFGSADPPQVRGRVAAVGAQPAEAAGGTRTGGLYPVVVALRHQDLEAIGTDRIRRGYTVQGKIITRSERIATLLWDFLLQRVEGRA